MTRPGVRCLPLALTAVALLFVASLFIYTIGNDFPYRFHPDERSKVTQIQTGRRNFLHPQLLLECTALIVGNQTGMTRQQVAETGRTVSAVAAAIAVSALAWTGYLEFGLLGLLCAGCSVGLCAQLVPYAHYMKEDAVFIMGLSLVMLAGRWFTLAERGRARWVAAVALGAAAGVAMSAKYVGALAVLPVIVWTLTVPRADRCPPGWGCLLVALAAAIVTVAAINHRAFQSPETFFEAIRFEFGHSLRGQKEGGLQRPNAYFLDAVWSDTDRWVLGSGVVYALVALFRPACRSRWTVGGVALTLVFLGTLSISSIPFHRYALPVIVLLHLWAALGWMELSRVAELRLPARSAWMARWALPSLALFIIVARCGAQTLDAVDQFQDDSRVRLRYWLQAHAKARDGVAGEFYSGIHEKARLSWYLPPVTQRRSELFDAAFEKPASNGVCYAVLCEPAYDRYLNPHARPVKGKEVECERRRALLQRIRREGRLVWCSAEDGRRNLHAFTNPLIEVYELPGSWQPVQPQAAP